MVLLEDDPCSVARSQSLLSCGSHTDCLFFFLMSVTSSRPSPPDHPRRLFCEGGPRNLRSQDAKDVLDGS